LGGDQLFGQFKGINRVFLMVIFVFNLEQQLYEVVTTHSVGVSEVDRLFYDAHEKLLHFGRERAQFQRLEKFWEEHSDHFSQR